MTTSTQKSQTDLNKLFNQYKTEKGQEYTNTSMGNPKKSLYIPEAEYDDFLDLYTKCLNEGLDLHLTEKPKEVSPLRIDLDFRFENTNTETKIIQDRPVILHKYTTQSVKAIVKEYFTILNTYFDIEPKCMKAYVQEKEYASTFRDKIKDGVHIIFPDILMGYELQHFVRSKMLQSEVFNDMNLSNKIDDVVDESIIEKNCWLLYGSKKLESEAYKVTALYSYDKVKADIIKLKLKDDKDYVRLFSMRIKAFQQNVLISSDEVHKYVEEWGKTKSIKTQVQRKSLVDFSYTSKDEIQLAQDLVHKCLSKSRAENYDDWINLGFTLHNISVDLLDTWDEFSQQGSSYKSGECQKLWAKMNDKNKGLGSLKYWAKEDNPDFYERIIENTLLPVLDIAMRSDGSHGDVADVIAKYMKDKIFYDCKAKCWFYVDHTNKWVSDSEGSFIYKLCKTSICRLFSERAMYWSKLAQQSEDTSKSDMCTHNAQKTLDIAKKLKHTPYVKHIIPQLKSVMYVDDFVEKYLDCNINLIAFESTVFDLEKCTFRKIEPTDYISITTGYEYDDNVDDDIVQEVKDILSSIFATEEMYSYVLDIITSLLYGKNLFQEFYIMTGTGSNGKSMLMNAISAAFGGYAKKINASTLTKPSRSANETSELYNCKGVRFIYTEEPDTDDKLITSRVKELSGDSKIKTRGLYANAVEYLPQFKIAMCCNDLIKLSKVDGGIARRLRVIEFKYKFVSPEKYDEANPYHKLVDVSINGKFAEDVRYKQAFMKILCDNWKNCVKGIKSLPQPVEVLEASKSYMEDCNPVLMYISEYYEITGNDKDHISAREMFQDFQDLTRNKSISETEFGNRLNEMGIPKKPYSQKKISHRFGIKKKEDEKGEFVEEE
jgi:P4 family phage/plasmid primase-like protien